MASKVFCPTLVAAMLLVGAAAVAEPVSDLLEKAVYTEETVGNLDEAIGIYKKIVADAKAARPLVAQAQYRLGMCLLKKGDKAEATKTLEDLIKRFPEQKEILAKAREHVSTDLQLKPVPWDDGEVLEMVVKLGGGMEFGTVFYTADAVEVDGRKVWRLQNRMYLGRGTRNGMSRVEADYQTFHPITSLWDLSVLGRFEAVYSAGKVKNVSTVLGKKKVHTVDVEGVVYDNEQGMHLFRRLPLADGYKADIPIFVTLSNSQLKLGVEVSGRETLQVPAGKFDCYKMELSIGQTFWFSADAKQYPVLVEAGGISMQLSAIQPPSPNQYEDTEFGFSLKAPLGWYFYKEPAGAKEQETLVSILDPDAEAISTLRVKKLDQLKPEEKASVRAVAEAGIPGAEKRFKDFKVRPDSWQESEISGRPAVSSLADYVDGQRKKVAWSTCILGESTASSFLVLIEPEKLAAFQKEFAPILEGYKGK